MEKKKSILVVDDSPGPRNALKMILSPFYAVTTAADGSEALQYFQKEIFGLVTLDLEMPGLSGIEVLREMKKIKAGIPVIIITGHDNLPQVREAIAQGAVNFISKPFVIHEVTTVVNKAISSEGMRISGTESPSPPLAPLNHPSKEI
jgi:DNA-binding NtrC family response regulator